LYNTVVLGGWVLEAISALREKWNEPDGKFQNRCILAANAAIGLAATVHYTRNYELGRGVSLSWGSAWVGGTVASLIDDEEPYFWLGRGKASVRETLAAPVEHMKRIFVIAGTLLTVSMFLKVIVESEIPRAAKRETESILKAAYKQPHLRWRTFVHVAIETPILEEIVHRGIIWEAVEGTRKRLLTDPKSEKGQFLSRVVRTSIFIAAHLWDCATPGAALTTAISVGWSGWLFEAHKDRTGSLWSSILCHSAHNGWVSLVKMY
jgi:membrane protease YdiL (CAAX protease family)